MVTCPVLAIDLRQSELSSELEVRVLAEGCGSEGGSTAPALGRNPVVSNCEDELFLCRTVLGIVLTEHI